MNFLARLLGVGVGLILLFGFFVLVRIYFRNDPLTRGELQNFTILTALFMGGLSGTIYNLKKIGEMIYVWRYGQFPYPSERNNVQTEQIRMEESRGESFPSFKTAGDEENYFKEKVEKWGRMVAIERMPGDNYKEGDYDREFKVIWNVLVNHKIHFSSRWKNLYFELGEIEDELRKEFDDAKRKVDTILD